MWQTLLYKIEGYKVHGTVWSGVLAAALGVLAGGHPVDLAGLHAVIPAVDPHTLVKCVWTALAVSFGRSALQRVQDHLGAVSVVLATIVAQIEAVKQAQADSTPPPVVNAEAPKP